MAVALLGALTVLSACHGSRGPKGEFLEGWLAEHAADLEPVDRERVVDTLLDCEEAYGIDALLLLAMIEEESTYDPAARSHRGAHGLMQLKPATAKAVARRLGIEADLVDPATNVRLGAAYLAELKDRFGAWDAALAAYNFGPRRIRQVEARGGVLPARYAARIRKRHARIRSEFRASGPG